MTRTLALLTSLALLAAGCQATASGQITAKPSSKSSDKPAAAAGRSVTVKVVGPGELAKGSAQILNDAGAGLIKGGQILNDAGAGFASRLGFSDAGAAHVPQFGLLASLTTFTAVKAAGVQALGLDGKAIGGVLTTDAEGGATISDLPKGKAVSVFAAFKSGGKVYRLAALLGADEMADTLLLDPINTMVEARVRDALAGKDASTTLTNERLKRVWGICNKADVTLKPEELEAGRSMVEITASLNKAWTAAIDAQVTSAEEKAEIKAFIADISAAVAK